MSRVDNCLYWQAIFRLMAVQYHCHSLIMACTTLSDTSIMFVHVCRKHVFARVPTQRASVQMTETGFVVYIVSFCVYGLLFLIGVAGGGWLGPIPAVSACWRVIYVIHTVEFKFGACMSVQRIWRRELEQSPHWTTNLKKELWRSVATAPATRCAICLAAHRYFLSTVKIYKNRFFFHHLQV